MPPNKQRRFFACLVASVVLALQRMAPRPDFDPLDPERSMARSGQFWVEDEGGRRIVAVEETLRLRKASELVRKVSEA